MEHEAKPEPITEEERLIRQKRRDLREARISKARAEVVKKQIIEAYEILESIRFDYVSDTMFRDYITCAKKELEGALSDFLLSEIYQEEKVNEVKKKTPKEYDAFLKAKEAEPTQG